MKIEFSMTIKDKKDHKYYQISNTPPHVDTGSIWINNQEGEGGTFDSQSFYEAIDKFFKENF